MRDVDPSRATLLNDFSLSDQRLPRAMLHMRLMKVDSKLFMLLWNVKKC